MLCGWYIHLHILFPWGEGCSFLEISISLSKECSQTCADYYIVWFLSGHSKGKVGPVKKMLWGWRFVLLSDLFSPCFCSHFPLLSSFVLFWSVYMMKYIIFYLGKCRFNLLQGEIRDLNNLGVWSRHYQIGNVSDFYKKSVVTLAILGCVLVYLCGTMAK